MSNLIQKAHGTGSATFASPTQVDTAIIVVYACNDGSGSIAPTDDKGNTYQLFSSTQVSPNDDFSGTTEIWYLPVSFNPVTAGVQVVTGHADPLGSPLTAPYVWIYEVRTNQTLITEDPVDIASINFGTASLTPNIPTPGFTANVGHNSTNPSATGDFCVASCIVGSHGGVVTSVDSPWTLDTVQGGNGVAYTFLANGVDTPVTFHLASAVDWGIGIGCFTADLPTGGGGTGNIITVKHTNPATSAFQFFSFTPSWGSAFSLRDGQSNDSGQIAAGTYSISETLPVGWSSSAVVSSGDPASAITLANGQTVTVTFTNTPALPGLNTAAKAYPWVA